MRTIDRIEELMTKQGIPRRNIKRTLATICDTSYQAVRDWFNGDTKEISPKHLAAIAVKLNTTTDYLISGEISLKDPAKDAEDRINKLPIDAQLELYEKLGRKIHEKLKQKQDDSSDKDD